MQPDRIKVIQAIIDRLRAKTYLEIGISNGDSFLPIRVPRKIGIDIEPRINFVKKWWYSSRTKDFKLFKMSSTDFFLTQKELLSNNLIGVAFVDGAHTYRQSLEDIVSILPYMHNHGIIVVHDCNPTLEQMAIPAASYQEAVELNVLNSKREWCGDVWKAIVHLRSTRPGFEIFTLDTDYGLGIIRKRNSEGFRIDPDSIESMTFQDLDENREDFLNLKPISFLNPFLKTIDPIE